MQPTWDVRESRRVTFHESGTSEVSHRPSAAPTRAVLSARGYVDLLGKDDGEYWGEIEQPAMRRLIERSEQVGYRTAVREAFRHSRRDLFAYILNVKERVAFLDYLDSAELGDVLDLGSGLGAIPAGLAPHARTVTSLEQVRERVEFQVIRRDQDRIGNWEIVRGDALTLPFPSDSFDFVSANGVLEWIALTGQDKPRLMQEHFLSEIYRVLRPDGICYIGIENRFGLQYWGGALDHSGIRYTSLVPRSVADILVRRHKADTAEFAYERTRRYRTYTYTRRGYTRLLRRSGFTSMRVVHSAWSYDFALAGIDDESVSHAAQAHTIVGQHLPQFQNARSRARSKLGAARSPTFLLFARKGERRIISQFERDVCTTHDESGPFFFYHGFNGRLLYSLATHTFYRSVEGGKPIATPELVPSTDVPSLTLFGATLAEARKRYYKTVEADEQRFGKLLEDVRRYARTSGLPERGVDAYLAALRRHARSPLFTQTHGDLWRGNVFFDRSGIVLIDEEADSLGLLPTEIARFVMSEVGYVNHDWAPYLQIIDDELAGLVTSDIVTDFRLLALFAEVWRYDPLHGIPRTEFLGRYDVLERELNDYPAAASTRDR